MSKYTTQIRFICESAIPLEHQGDGSFVDTAIESGREKLFNFEYDLFDPLYKEVIETKFLRHNYTREIGFETVGLFKLKLQDLWLMKLPYYNQLWNSALIEFNPMYDVDYTTDHKGTGSMDRQDKGVKNSNSSFTNKTVRDGSSDGTEDLINKYSDTPQGGLDGVIDTDWLTNATVNDNENHNEWEDEATQTGTGVVGESTGLISGVNTTDDYLRRVVGKMAGKSYSKMLQEYRDTFLNIDEMFIKEFRNLFMLIY